jgi:hypothetical protein
MQGLLANLDLTEPQARDGAAHAAGVRSTLNRHYHDVVSQTLNSRLIGSWGKGLQVRPPRDIDVLFCLPWAVHQRFEARAGNRQSQLLQEVKTVLTWTYPRTEMGGDGQVVVVSFETMPVEVVPAFDLYNGQFLICDTNGGGTYRLSDPAAELAALDVSDATNGGAARNLIRILKQWQRHTTAPLKSFLIERLAIEFLETWSHSRDLFWYDWMIRDALGHIARRAGGFVSMPGTGATIALGDGWAAAAADAYAAALRACNYEHQNENLLAGLAWQEIFGAEVPLYIA